MAIIIRIIGNIIVIKKNDKSLMSFRLNGCHSLNYLYQGQREWWFCDKCFIDQMRSSQPEMIIFLDVFENLFFNSNGCELRNIASLEQMLKYVIEQEHMSTFINELKSQFKKAEENLLKNYET